MEEHKWRYLQAILLRNPAVGLEDYLRKIKALDAQAQRSYSESIELDSNEFLKMKLLDGCFIVELFAKHLKEEGEDDPIYGNSPLLHTVAQDMLLLENQLPYCILQCIFSCVFPDEHVDVKLVEEAIGFFDDFPWRSLMGHRRENSCHHLLHLIHFQCLRSTLPSTRDKLLRATIPSAKKLESRIVFKRKADEECVLNVEFKNGVIEIPYLFMNKFNICLFRNFLAFEQCYRSSGSYFTAYTDFMHEIISTKTDVEILRNERILEHGLGGDEELALLLNGLDKGNCVATNNFYLSALFNNVNEYCDTSWHRWRASLMHDYFRNPRAILALIAAIVVLILTAIQSFFSVYAYARPLHQS